MPASSATSASAAVSSTLCSPLPFPAAAAAPFVPAPADPAHYRPPGSLILSTLPSTTAAASLAAAVADPA